MKGIKGISRACVICKIIKPLNSDIFVKCKGRPYGLAYECKECSRIRSKEKYKQFPRKDRYSKMTPAQKARKYEWTNNYKRNTLNGKTIARKKSYMSTDAKKGRVCDLTNDFLSNLLQKPCVYCGETDISKMGCDRIDNNLGHIIANVVPCCDECNIARFNHFSYEEMMIIGAAIRIVKDNRRKNVSTNIPDPTHFSMVGG
jgi:5-methylcytosine-specific restriction endonuclease McrA